MTEVAYDYGDEYAFWEDTKCIIPQITHDIRPRGNQANNKETKSACTIVWAVNQIIRLFGLDLTTKQTNTLYIDAVHYCEKYGYVIGSWWWVPTAVDHVRKRWNEVASKTFKKEQVFTKRLLWDNAEIKEALEKWHLVGFSKTVNFWIDQVEWLVWRDPKMYPKMVWHRLNRAWVKYIKATWWADISKAERWAMDNYHWAIGEYFAFKTLKPYMYHGINGYWYLILPVSCLESNIEKEKERIQRLKAVNATIWVLSTTWWDLNSEEQLMSSALATELRNTEWARAKIDDVALKNYQALVDHLSYAWKFAWEEEQKKYSELASYLRDKFNLL